MHSGQDNRERGFSLVELALMIALIGVMAGSYFMGALNFNAGAVDRASRRIESDLRYAQQLAMTEEANHGLLSLNGTSYRMYRLNTGTPITDPHSQQAMNVDLTIDYQGVSFGGNYQVEFDSNGRPVVGSGAQIVLNNGAQTRTVTVTPTTGYIQVQ